MATAATSASIFSPDSALASLFFLLRHLRCRRLHPRIRERALRSVADVPTWQPEGSLRGCRGGWRARGRSRQEGAKSKRQCKRGVYIYVFAEQLKYFVLCAPSVRRVSCAGASLSVVVCKHVNRTCVLCAGGSGAPLRERVYPGAVVSVRAGAAGDGFSYTRNVYRAPRPPLSPFCLYFRSPRAPSLSLPFSSPSSECPTVPAPLFWFYPSRYETLSGFADHPGMYKLPVFAQRSAEGWGIVRCCIGFSGRRLRPRYSIRRAQTGRVGGTSRW